MKWWLIIKNYFWNISDVAGIQLHLHPDGSKAGKYIRMTQKGSTIFVQKKGAFEDDMSSLTRDIPLSIPISLTITGKGILYKHIDKTQLSDNEIIQSVLPGVNENDFFYTAIKAERSTSVYLVRESVILDILQTITQLGYKVIHLHIGGLILSDLALVLSQEWQRNTFRIGEYNFSYSNDGVYDVEKKVVDEAILQLHVGEDIIEDNEKLAYASGLQAFLPSSFTLSKISSININREEYLYKGLYKKSGLGILCFFFSILLINFFFYNFYSSKYNHIFTKQASDSYLINQLKDLESKYLEKESFLRLSDWNNSSKNSLYINRIIASVTTGLQLTELRAHPVDMKKFKEQKNIAIEPNVIKIKGNCKHSTGLNNWLKILSGLVFIHKIDVKNYVYDNYEQVGKFELVIMLKSNAL